MTFVMSCDMRYTVVAMTCDCFVGLCDYHVTCHVTMSWCHVTWFMQILTEYWEDIPADGEVNRSDIT